MPTSYTTLLGLAKPATGELTGTWGNTVNNYITEYVDAAVAGAQVISGSQTAVTLSTTNGGSLVQAGSGATGSAQYSIIRCTGNPASLLTITAPATSKAYLVINNTSTGQSVKLVGAGPTAGIFVASNQAALVAWNGTDFALIATTDITQLSGTLAVANGGTGTNFLTANNVLLGNGTSAVQVVAPGAAGNVLASTGTTWVSSSSVTSLNGQSGAITNTSVDAVGSYIVALYVPGTHPATSGPSLSVNNTVAGSTLYYNYTNASGGDFTTGFSSGSSSYSGGGTTLSGTWRCMGRPGYAYSAGGPPSYSWLPGLFVRTI